MAEPNGFLQPTPPRGTEMHSSMRRVLYGLVTALVVTDLAWSSWSGLTIGGWWRTVVAISFLLTVSMAYRHRARSVAIMTENAALWLAVGAAGCTFTYLCATWSMPLQDATLTRIDQALGFDWLAWRNVVLASPILHWTLIAAYGSLMPQIVFALIYLPAVRLSARCYELLLLSVSTLLVTSVMSGLWPALCPIGTYGGDETMYLPHLRALRAAGPWHFDLVGMQGIITMPSYHTVLAMLFTYAFRRTGWVGSLIAALNGLMLLSLPPIGGHYVADMIAGFSLTAAAILTLRWTQAGYPAPRVKRVPSHATVAQM